MLKTPPVRKKNVKHVLSQCKFTTSQFFEELVYYWITSFYRISLKDQELGKKEVNNSPSASPTAEKYSMDVSGRKMKEMDPQQNPKASTQINIKRPQTRAIFRYPTLGQMVSSDRATIPYLPKSKTSPIVNSSLPQQSIKSTTLSQQAGAASGCFKTPATLPIPRTTCKRARPKTPPMQEAQPKPPKLIPKLVPVQQAPQIQNATPDQNTGYLLKSIVNVESKRLQVERDHYRRLECVGNNVLRKLNEMLPDIKEGEQKDQK